ncbi:cholesterol esterase [Streptomyces sp. NRRL B-1568]|nr:cholesterol esterase [Streptomyces sp. NRRL B-1568]
MKDAQGRQVTGRVRWRKFAVLSIPGFAATAALAVALAQGALAASFAVSGQEFKVGASSLEGEGFAQYGGVDKNARGKLLPVAVTAIKSAKIHDLCQSVVTTLPLIGDITLELTAGKGDKPVEATDLFLDATQMSGDATFENIEIGRDASTLNKGPASAQGLQDAFGQQAKSIKMAGLHQTAWATNAGKFKLAGLDMKVGLGKRECF